jgi:glycosyltransferase involved in cell wall biosynthesis
MPGAPLIVLHSHYFHPRVGGCEVFTDLLASGLVQAGFRVRVVTETPLDGAPELARDYAIVRTVSWSDPSSLDGAAVLIAKGPSIRYLRQARRRRIPYILVHAGPHGVCPVAIGWRNGQRCSVGFPRCLTCKVGAQRGLENVRDLVRFGLLRWGMAQAQANVFVSHYLRDRVPARRSQVIWNSFDEAMFTPGQQGAEQPPVFAFVGRLVSVKGVDTALRAFALARQQGLCARLRIVGSGPLEGPLRQLAAELGVVAEVEFRPLARPAEVAEVFRTSYAALVPSQWEEPFGIVVAEAMGCGCPVIGSAHGALPEIIGATGIVVPAGDVTAWAKAMTELAADGARRQRLAEAAADRAAREFARRRMVQQYRQLVEQVLDGQR